MTDNAITYCEVCMKPIAANDLEIYDAKGEVTSTVHESCLEEWKKRRGNAVHTIKKLK
jgi:hypothetical protein